MKNIVLFVLIIVACCMIGNIEAEVCNPYTGPEGAKMCMKLPNYNGYQWATCRRDSNTRSKTRSFHKCVNIHSKYSYHLCMQEKYYSTSGDVLGDCQCSSAESHKAKFYNLLFACFVVFVINYLFVS